jgi:hypothetical protein
MNDAVARSSTPSCPKKDAVRHVTSDGSPSSHRNRSMSWIECSMSVPPPATSTSARHAESYCPWLGKYWSSRIVTAIGRP